MSNEKVNGKSNLTTLQDNINQLKTRFDKIRDEANSKLNECGDCIEAAEELCREATETNTDLRNELADVSSKENELEDIKVKLATTSFKGKVILDVGGEKHTTNV